MEMNQYHMPAEWEPQEAIILSWPHNLGTWTKTQLPVVEKAYCCLISEITEHQKVWLNVRSEQEKAHIKRLLAEGEYKKSNLFFLLNPTHDVWVRDYGPLYVVDKKHQKRVITKWFYNGYGGKYGEEYSTHDNQTPYAIAELMHEELYEVGTILEGGSIDVNGKGTLLTTTDCLLNKNRNSELSEEKIEETLKTNLGVQKIIWATGEIKGDDTDGHIDDAVRFVSDNHLLCISEDNSKDVNYEGIQSLKQSLRCVTDQDDKPIEVTYLPMPDPVYFEETRLPASYANFLITNQKVLVPVYNCEKDAEALRIIKGCFSEREVVGIDCSTLVAGFGAIHCISMQVPAVGKEKGLL